MKRMKKEMRPLLPLLLLAALLLTACGGSETGVTATPAPTAAPIGEQATATPTAALSLEDQKQLLEDNRTLWAFDDPYDSPWFYTFTDLDHNGRLEVIAATTQGSGIFTYAHFYEVRADGSGIDSCYEAQEEWDDWPEIILDSLPSYYDAATDQYWYACEGITRDGAAHQYYSWQALSLKDGAAVWEGLAYKEMEWRNGGEGPYVTCADLAGNPISEADYDSAVARRFAGMEKSTLTLDWTRVEIPIGDPPAPAETAAPNGPAVVITKNPTSETISVGGKTWFIAHAENADRLTWLLISPDNQTYTMADAMAANPGLKLEALEGDTIAVSDVPLSFDGWAIQARFDGPGGSAVTLPAYLYVGDYVAAYGSVLDRYRTYFAAGSHDIGAAIEQGLSDMSGYFDHVGYAFKDIDKDGIPELFVAGIDEEGRDLPYYEQSMLFGVYTLESGQPKTIYTGNARDRIFLRTDNTLYNSGSGGASYSINALYQLKGGELELVEAVITWPTEDGQDIRYYRETGTFSYEPRPEDMPISAEEYTAAVERYEAGSYIPPLTKLA